MFAWNQLSRGVRAIFFVQIVNRMGDFVFPFLTLLLTQVQGLKPLAAGLVVTLASAMGSLGALVAGHLGDEHPRRRVLVAFLAVSATLVGAAGFAPAHLASAVALVASGFFIGAMRPLLGALVADLSPPELRRQAFGLSYLGINIGVAAGPLLAGWLFNHALAWMFWLDALSTGAALLILVRFVPALAPPRRDDGAPARPRGTLAAFVRHPVLPIFGLLVMVYNLVYSQMIFTLALQLVELFGGQGPATYGFVWALNALTVVATTPLALRLTRSWTNLRSMVLAMVLIASGVAVFLFHPDLIWVVVSTLLWSTGEVFFSIHVGDLVTGQSPPEVRATYQGYVTFLTSLGFVAAPLTGGAVTTAFGLPAVRAAAVVLTLAVGFGFALLDRRARH